MGVGVRAWLALVLLLALAAGARAGVSAEVDRDRIALSESFRLVIRAEGSIGARELDLAPLARDFEVLGTSRNSSFTITNGRSESATTWEVSLLARRAGELTIPPLEVGGERTAPVTIRVTEDPAPASDATRDVQLEVETDAAEVHAQQQLLVTVRVLHAVNLNRGASLEAPEIPDAVVRELGEHSYEKTVDGRRFGVFERRYAVFPQKSGELVIPALGFEATVGGSAGWFDQSGRRAKMLRLRSEEKRVRVLPPEDGATPWLPARVLTVIETWDRSPQELRVGDSATRTVTITATGLTGAQLPPLPTPAVEGLRFYPDQPRIEDAQDDEGITGTRVEASAVIPQRAGDIEFPEVRVRWWDTVNGRFEEAVVPRRTIRVLPGANAAPAPVPPATADAGAAAPAAAEAAATPPATAPPGAAPLPAAAPWPWIVATLLLALATAFSSWQWWRAARTAPRPGAPPAEASHDAREAELFAALRDACRAGDASQVQALLPRWGRAAFPHAGIRSCSDIGAAAHDDALREEIERLLASLYATDAIPADLSALLTCLQAARTAAAEQCKRTTGSDELPPLYAEPVG